jgi:hypothetical protein
MLIKPGAIFPERLDDFTSEMPKYEPLMLLYAKCTRETAYAVTEL